MSAEQDKTSVVICEDQRLFRHLLSHYLLHYPEFMVVGEASEGQDALDLCQRHKPDLVILDLNLSGSVQGFDILKHVKKSNPETRVMIISGDEDAKTMRRAVRLGADGYVEKTAPIETVCQAIYAVAEGHPYFSPKAEALLDGGPKA